MNPVTVMDPVEGSTKYFERFGPLPVGIGSNYERLRGCSARSAGRQSLRFLFISLIDSCLSFNQPLAYPHSDSLIAYSQCDVDLAKEC